MMLGGCSGYWCIAGRFSGVLGGFVRHGILRCVVGRFRDEMGYYLVLGEIWGA